MKTLDQEKKKNCYTSFIYLQSCYWFKKTYRSLETKQDFVDNQIDNVKTEQIHRTPPTRQRERCRSASNKNGLLFLLFPQNMETKKKVNI